MKATGIVRRIDDLGRVVIPKEIRRTMRIREERLVDNIGAVGSVQLRNAGAGETRRVGYITEMNSRYGSGMFKSTISSGTKYASLKVSCRPA